MWLANDLLPVSVIYFIVCSVTCVGIKRDRLLLVLSSVVPRRNLLSPGMLTASLEMPVYVLIGSYVV